MLRARGCAILMATRDVPRVNALADRVGILQSGRLVLEPSRAEREHEDLMAIYMGYMTPPLLKQAI
jgi:ABC-type sugar transport system ATPase subunit